MITESSLEELKSRIDIVDTIANYIELKKAGANYKAPCPFHDEKSGSFVVSPQKQIYHCFGCGAGGDAIRFVQEYKKLEFVEAVEEIANDLNFTLTYDSSGENRKDYTRLMEHVNGYYVGKRDAIAAYLQERGVTKESMDAFEIGYAPSSAEQLSILKDAAFNVSEASECGITAYTDGRTYARLTDRVTFPIRNHTGKLIGFGGRILSGDRAKYLNSPQTPLFDKSRHFYGYHIAKAHVHKKGTFTVTEGYLDVVMFHQAGIRTAVATMGTALTEQHCRTIQKAKAKALLCYDGDKAGRAAALKAAKLLSAHEVYGGVVLFPEGKDPADMVRDGKGDELIALMKRPAPLIPFVIVETAAAFNLTRPDEKQNALHEITAFLDTLPPLIRDEYKPLVASTLRIDQAHIATRNEPATQNRPTGTAPRINIAEMSVIKTAAEDDRLFDIVLDYIDTDAFDLHAYEFDLLKTGDGRLPGILIGNDLRLYTEQELITQLRIMRIKSLEKELTAIAHSHDSFERQSFEVRRIKGEIMDLKKQLNKKD